MFPKSESNLKLKKKYSYWYRAQPQLSSVRLETQSFHRGAWPAKGQPPYDEQSVVVHGEGAGTVGGGGGFDFCPGV